MSLTPEQLKRLPPGLGLAYVAVTMPGANDKFSRLLRGTCEALAAALEANEDLANQLAYYKRAARIAAEMKNEQQARAEKAEALTDLGRIVKLEDHKTCP